MTLKADFEFVQGLVQDFFASRHLRRTLVAIEADEISGWEKWLQIELAQFFREHDQIKAWWRESSYKLDRRVAQSRTQCAVDFLLHQARKQSHMALEVKQVDSVNNCVAGMLLDRRKISRIRGGVYDIRSVWCLGIHKAASQDEVRRKLVYHADRLEVEYNDKFFDSRRIGRTGYSYTLF